MPAPTRQFDPAHSDEQIRAVYGPYGETDAKGRTCVRYKLVLADGSVRNRKFTTAADAARFEQTARVNMVKDRGIRTIGELVAAFIERKMSRRSPWKSGTLKRTRRDLLLFAQPESTPLTALTPRFVELYMRRLEALPAGSAKKRFAAAAGLCKWAFIKHHIKANPLAALDADDKFWCGQEAQDINGKDQLDPDGEIDAYLDAAQLLPYADLRLAAQLPYLCGMRSGEVCNLKAGDIDWRRNVIHIRGPHLKTKKSARAPEIPPELVADLKIVLRDKLPTALLFPGPKTGEVRGNRWLREQVVHVVCDKAGVKRICPHALRGSYATALALRGLDLPSIGDALGHADKGVTAQTHYVRALVVQPSLSRQRTAA